MIIVYCLQYLSFWDITNTFLFPLIFTFRWRPALHYKNKSTQKTIRGDLTLHNPLIAWLALELRSFLLLGQDLLMFLQMDFFSNLITQVRDLSRCNFVFLQFYIFAILNESRFQEWEKDPSREIEYWHWRSNGCKIGTFCVGVDTKKVMTMAMLMMMRMRMVMMMMMMTLWWRWRSDVCREAKASARRAGQTFRCIPNNHTSFFAVFCDFFNNKIVFHHYLMNINTNF